MWKGKGYTKKRKAERGVNMIKDHCKYAWKCNNNNPYFVQLKLNLKLDNQGVCERERGVGGGTKRETETERYTERKEYRDPNGRGLA